MKFTTETSQPDFKSYLSSLWSCRRGRGWAEGVQSVLQEAVLHRLFLSVRRWSGAAQREDDAAAQTEGTSHSLERANQEVWLAAAPTRNINREDLEVYLHF